MSVRVPSGLPLLAAVIFCFTAILPAAEATLPPPLPLLHPLFADGAVIQRDVAAPVWGWSTPGQKVSVVLADKDGKEIAALTAAAAADGRWECKLPVMTAGGPYTLTVNNTHKASDLWFGDVWICSGQSNMEMGIRNCLDAEREIGAAVYPQLRLLALPKKTSLTPQPTFTAEWKPCQPDNLASMGSWGGFSAAAYFFGRDLQKEIKVPVGLVHTSWGGTVAEAWTGEAALAATPEYAAELKIFREGREEELKATTTLEQRIEKWWTENDPGTQPGADWAALAFDDSAWKDAKLPGVWENSILPDFDGLVWFRRKITLPEGWENKELVLSLGPIDDIDTTYVNGKAVGGFSVWNTPRIYKLPAGTLKAGENVIAVRVLDTGGGGGIYGTPAQMNLAPADDDGKNALSLAGDWKFSAAKQLREMPPFPQRFGGNPNVCTVLYNAMLHPLFPAAVKGAIWYQGESNAWAHNRYRALLTSMINDWRQHFTLVDGKFPFGIVMLAGFMKVAETPVEDNTTWPFLREAQAETAATVKDAGIISAVDIGETDDIHPRNKQEVGRRLALLMLRNAYNDSKQTASGPVCKEVKIEGNTIRVQFAEVGGGLVSKDGQPLKWFAICGADKKFFPATAIIDGDSVIVSSPVVDAPTAVRYAWANNPLGANLYNKEGLPALPFRSDK